MCTVTYIPKGNNFILTSNRDEYRLRETLPPKIFFENGTSFAYPKDKIAGGTWIGISDKKRLVCVLNGAFKKHTRKLLYKKSRGLIAKELLARTNCSHYCSKINLEGVEPFTIVIVEWHNVTPILTEFIWDEKQKYISVLKNEPKIWSSSTLYTSEVKKWREDLFFNWLDKNDISSKSMLDFHHLEEGKKDQSILMKRQLVETVSITQVVKNENQIKMSYKDLVLNKANELNF